MRIIHFVDSLSVGGVTTVALQLTEQQLRDGHEVSICQLHRGDWEDRARDQRIPIHTGLRQFATATLGRRVDIIHAHQRRCGLIGFSLGHGRKTVEHVHNHFSDRRSLSYRCAHIVAVSTSIEAQTRRAYPHVSGKITTIRNGVQIPSNITSKGLRKFQIVACGRLSEQKDPMLFLQLASRISRTHPDLHWIWVGDGPLKNRWLHERRSLGLEQRVQHFPALDHPDVVALMAKSTLTVLTSAWEGLPMVALESLAVGTPVLSTNVGELNTLLAQVIPFGPLNSADIQESCDTVLAALKARAYFDPTAIRSFATAELSLDASMQRWQSLYADIVNQRG